MTIIFSFYFKVTYPYLKTDSIFTISTRLTSKICYWNRKVISYIHEIDSYTNQLKRYFSENYWYDYILEPNPVNLKFHFWLERSTKYVKIRLWYRQFHLLIHEFPAERVRWVSFQPLSSIGRGNGKWEGRNRNRVDEMRTFRKKSNNGNSYEACSKPVSGALTPAAITSIF